MTAYQPFHVPLKEAARILGYCTRTLYNMHAAGELKLSKRRRRTFVPVSELDRIKAELERENESDGAPGAEAGKQQPVREPVREPVAAKPKKRRLVPLDR